MSRVPYGQGVQVLPIERCGVTEGPAPTAPPHTVAVVAAVIAQNGRLLVTRRLRGTHLEGFWEFPGGKIDVGETHEAALRREIREELGAEAQVADLILSTTHSYTERTVLLHFYRCILLSDARPLLGQEMRWVDGAGLAGLKFPPADEELIKRLRTGGS
jgi:8-oxo-dGTP diphosphatase